MGQSYFKHGIKHGEGYVALGNAIIVQAAKDYMSALQSQQKSDTPEMWDSKIKRIEDFFRSDWCYFLSPEGLDDGEYLIKTLRERSGTYGKKDEPDAKLVCKLYYDEYMNIKAICKKYNLSEYRVRQILMEEGKGIRKNQRTARQEKLLTKETLQELYVNQGMTAREIGRKFDVSEMTIINYLKKFNIPRRKRGAKKK